MRFNTLSVQALVVASGLLAAFATSVAPSARPTASVIAPIDLGLAATYGVLAGSAVTSAGKTGTKVYGDVGVHPGSAVDGFPPAECFGAIDAGNAAAGDAKADLVTAYNAAAARASTNILSGQDLGGMTLSRGVFTYDSTATLNGDLTLDALGDVSSVWIFQIASALNIAQSGRVIFKDGLGNADNVYFQVGSSVTVSYNADILGNYMAFQAITVATGAAVNGRLLARNAAVTLDFNSVKIPDYLIFNSNINIEGITLETISANGQDAIVATAATCMEIDDDYVEFVSSVPTQTAARRRALRTDTTIGLLATYDQLVLIKTELALSETDYATTTEMYNALTKKLSDAIASGLFTSTLQANAVTFNAPELANAGGTSVVSEDPGAPADSNDDDKLSGGAIAGIVIGCVAFVVILALLLYFCCCHGSKAEAEAEPKAVPTSDL